LLYAVGVGAGVDELSFTTENSDGVEQQVIPTFAIVAGPTDAILDRVGDIDPTMLVHGEQGLEVFGRIPVEGEVLTTTRITGVYDKRSGAVITMEAVSRSADTGAPLFRVDTSAFVRGAGGFGGDPGPSRQADEPDGPPHSTVALPTTIDQPLVYRLSGDRNPLHSDPAFAQRAGFDRPILHGLCTYGVTCRALVRELCDGDATRLRTMWGRFTSPVFPGETLTVELWDDAGSARFRTRGGDGRTVVDGGRVSYRAALGGR
jgi:acyl dehydratase